MYLPHQLHQTADDPLTSVCFYFEVHQPFRLRNFHFFDIVTQKSLLRGEAPPVSYFDDAANAAIVRKVAQKCYLPATATLLDMIARHEGRFRVTFSISGVAIEQFRRWAPEVLHNFRSLAATGCVEFLAETYYHSLSALYSEREFREQVALHIATLREEFGVTPTAFRNTELIFSDHVARQVADMGFHGILMEGAERVLGWRSPNFPYRAAVAPELTCLLKNYRLSDDIAFRFSDRGWSEHPLTVEKFARWVHNVAGDGTVLGLFMDFETFGEHQWADTGIFRFLDSLPIAVLRRADFEFHTVSEVIRRHPPVGEISSEAPVSWADMERDLSAWTGNSMQREALAALYDTEDIVREAGDAGDLDIFRKLQTSDHFYYMCTKYFNDGDVHKYFSPYGTPHEAYVYFMNVLHDFRCRLRARRVAKKRAVPMGQLALRSPDSAAVSRPGAHAPAAPRTVHAATADRVAVPV
jgi:alpha-amylase